MLLLNKQKSNCRDLILIRFWSTIQLISIKWKITSHLDLLNTKKTTTYDVRNPERQGLAWDRHKNVAGLNWLMGSKHSTLDNWISNGTYI